jgi:hypothetical protein
MVKPEEPRKAIRGHSAGRIVHKRQLDADSIFSASRTLSLAVENDRFTRIYGSRVITLKYILCVKTHPESALFYPTKPVEKEVN